MRKLIAIVSILSLVVCSCKTKYIETIHYEPVEIHDTVNSIQHIRDSITLHDSVYIHTKNDTVYSEKWRTEHHWHTKRDTVYKSKEVPKVVTDTIVKIREVPVDKVVYKQHWWQNALSWIGGLFSLGLLISLIINIRK